MSSLRLLSWNTQLRSWGMEMGIPPTIPPDTNAEERAEHIAAGILASPFDYDVVGLCEVFDEDARDILRARLRGRFPWIVTKCDFGFVGTELGAAPLVELPLQGLTFLSGLVLNPRKLLDYRPEDSGLMLFSRWPFATRGLLSFPPDVVALLQAGPLGAAIPANVPIVGFLPFAHATGNDRFAAKGMLYARIDRGAGTLYHLFLSHTQADEEHVEEHAGARAQQMVQVEEFVSSSVGPIATAGDVFFMGDLNIRGEPHDEADGVSPREWRRTFDEPGRLLVDELVDLWGRRQCTGSKGLRDPGITASMRYPPQEQRLDYVVGSANGLLAAQHLSIDHELATPPPGRLGLSGLSDHLPLRIDLAAPRPFSTPHGAMKMPAPQPVFFGDRQWILEGQVVWYRFDKAGTYDFDLVEGADRCGFEVYLDTDLSRPRRQYRAEVTPRLGKKFVLASAPFLVKVFPFSRSGEARYHFTAHLHQGTSPEDVIQLPYGVPVAEAFPDPVPGPQLLNPDHLPTPWSDADTKWFRLDGPTVPLGSPLAVSIVVESVDGEAPFGVRLARVVGGAWTLLDQAGPGGHRLELRTSIEHGDQLFVCVFRDDLPALRRLAFRVTATTDLSLLLGGSLGRPRLVCTDETSGWGADDIELDISVDGRGLRYVRNAEIGDMEQDDVRELDQWIPEIVPYQFGVKFRVVELDAIDPNDIGDRMLPPHGELATSPAFTVERTNPDGGVRGSLHVDVDDGRYDFLLTVTTWDERF